MTLKPAAGELRDQELLGALTTGVAGVDHPADLRNLAVRVRPRSRRRSSSSRRRSAAVRRRRGRSVSAEHVVVAVRAGNDRAAGAAAAAAARTARRSARTPRRGRSTSRTPRGRPGRRTGQRVSSVAAGSRSPRSHRRRRCDVDVRVGQLLVDAGVGLREDEVDVAGLQRGDLRVGRRADA